jgi:hypothetical protein
METSVVVTTVNVALPAVSLTVAEIVALPAELPVAKPAELTVAVFVFEDVHVALDVTLPVVPLL